jgi:hypothetical protein
MSWEIFGRMEMFSLHATLPTLLSYATSYLVLIGMGPFICETSTSTDSLLQVFLFQLCGLESLAKINNYNNKFLKLKLKSRKSPK